MAKKTVAVLFGGASNEHEVSLKSATYVIDNIPKMRYKIKMIGITKAGEWFLYSGDTKCISDGSWEKSKDKQKAFISPDTATSGIVILNDEGGFETIKIDVIFPVLHGKNGEDGSIQGLAQLANIPCVGCDMTSSVVCMDKSLTNILADHAGIKQANFMWLYSYIVKHHTDIAVTYVENNIDGYPVFVKPTHSGSSVGISKVYDSQQLRKALISAAEISRKIVIEECVEGREIECALIGDDDTDLDASELGEIVPDNEFYDYDAKYVNNQSKLSVPAELEEEIANKIKALSREVYLLMGCTGMARVDFFLKDDGEVYLNEINTIPGFTDISMYPKLMEKVGIPIDCLLDRLISTAIEGAEKY